MTLTTTEYKDIQKCITLGDCIRDLEIIAKASDPEDLADRVQYLPL
ncbi:hypothetical protein V0288_03485 [Pannus brasiliensis CCIBt3594]|uniref:Uncharacterized protein n=1 Tax=Pannus brasiliensis CCIBt3594 TaxID=1427578 RepID=A0AAW9QRE0_9CHRO